jgi:hypothetical protein
MYYALVIKATEISRYGIVEIGDKEWFSRSKRIKEALLNNLKDYNAGDRFSNTSKLEKFYGNLREESYELLSQIKHVLMGIGPAFGVLEKLAQEPVALRRVRGHDWNRIEEDLEVEVTEEDSMNIKMGEVVDLRIITDCESIEEWTSAVVEVIMEDPEFKSLDKEEVRERVENYVGYKRNEGEMIWSDTLGSVATL